MNSPRGPRFAAVLFLGTLMLGGCGGPSQSETQPVPQRPSSAPSSDQTPAGDTKAAGPARAATRSIFDSIGERYALLIGVRNYDKMSGLHPLRYTESDATELAKVLLEDGYRPENVILMTDSQGATDPRLLPESRKIQTQLKSILRDRGKADQIMIAFSGHGLQFKDDKDSYFCPLDAQVDDRSTLVSMGDLYQRLEDSRAGFKLLLCDACRDDPMIGTSRGIADILGIFRDDAPPPGGVAVFYACSPGEFAREDPDLRHGVFFNYIIEGLRGAADMDNDGKVMLPELEYHAKRRVSDFVRSEFGGQRQMPNLKGDLLGLVALTDKKKASAPVAPPIEKPTVMRPDPVATLPTLPSPRPSAETAITKIEPKPSSVPVVVEPPRPVGDPSIDITPGPPVAVATPEKQELSLAKMPVMTPRTGEVRRFEDMGWGVDSLAFSPNGRWLAAGKSDRTVLLFDVPDAGNLDFRDDLKSLGQVTSVTFSPDGTRLLAAGGSGLIQVWLVKPAGRLAESSQYVGHNGQVHTMHVRSDGKFVLSAGSDRRLHFWQVDTGRLVRCIEGFKSDVRAAHFDDSTTALASDGEALLRIDLATGEIVRRFKLGHSSPHAAAFSADGRLLVVSEMYNLIVWDTRTGRKLGTCEGREIQWSVAFTPQADRLVSGGTGKVSVWDLKTFFRVHQAEVAQGSGYVQALAVAPDGRHVAAMPSSAGKDLQIFRISQPAGLESVEVPDHPAPDSLNVAATDLANSNTTVEMPAELPPAEIAPGQSPLAALPAYDTKSNEIRRFDQMGWGVQSMDFSPNGRWLAAGKSDRAVLLLDVVEGGRLDFRDNLESLGQVNCITFSPDGSHLLAGGYTGRIEVWTVTPQGRLKDASRYVGQNKEVNCICVRDDGKYVLSGGQDAKLHFWELATGRVVRIVDGFKRTVSAVHFADETTALATDGEFLKQIDLESGEVTRQFKPDCGSTQAAAFSPDGRFLALSNTYDLVLIDTRSGLELRRCETGETPWTAAFTPDGKRLVSGGRGKISVWNFDNGFKIHQNMMANEIGYVQALAVARDGRHVAAIVSMAGQDLQVFRFPER